MAILLMFIMVENRKNLIRISLLLIGVVANSFATTWYVDASKADNSGLATNWATAVRDIQAAVDMVSDYDKILVTNGLYNQGGAVSDLDSTMTNRVALNSNQKFIVIEAVNKGLDDTIIEGAPDYGTGGAGPGAIRCFHGNVHNGNSDDTVVLNGFTLRNGYTKYSGVFWADQAGGAIHSARATNCWFYSNHGYNGGGAWAYSQLRDCHVFNNSAWQGGAGLMGEVWGSVIYNNYASRQGGAVSGSILHSCTISNNAANTKGGAIYGGSEVYYCFIIDNYSDQNAGVFENACVVSNCIISHNTSVGTGAVGFQYSSDSRSYIYNCLIKDNIAIGGQGSAIWGNITVVNSTIVNNKSSIPGQTAGLNGNDGSLIAINSIVYGNTNITDEVENNYTTNLSKMVNCLTSPTPTGMPFDGGGNITGAPLFLDDACHLANNSPAVDSGITTNVISIDIDRVVRPLDGNNDGSSLYDIGCYEHIYVRPNISFLVIK